MKFIAIYALHRNTGNRTPVGGAWGLHTSYLLPCCKESQFARVSHARASAENIYFPDRQTHNPAKAVCMGGKSSRPVGLCSRAVPEIHGELERLRSASPSRIHSRMYKSCPERMHIFSVFPYFRLRPVTVFNACQGGISHSCP